MNYTYADFISLIIIGVGVLCCFLGFQSGRTR